MKRVWLPLVVAAVLLTTGVAFAHTELASAEPAPGSTVAGPISRLTLNFSEPIDSGSGVQIFAGAFEAVGGVSTTTARNTLTVRLDPPLALGTYTVQWLAVGADGHPVSGSYQFAVSTASRPTRLWPLLAIFALLAVAGAGFAIWRRTHAAS